MDIIRILGLLDLLFDCRVIAKAMQRGGGEKEYEIRFWQAYQTLENLVRNLIHPKLVNDEQLGEAGIRKNSVVVLKRIAESQSPAIDLHARYFPSSFL